MSTPDPSHSVESTSNQRQRISSIAVRQMIISTAIMALVLVSLTEAFIIMRNTQEIAKGEENRHYSYLLADELRQSSDDLTRMVRTYSATSDLNYADYYQEILDIRNGEAPRPEDYHNIYWDFVVSTGKPPRPGSPPIALKKLMEKSGFSKTELNLLAKAEGESNALVNLEVQAMNAMIGLYRDASGNYTVKGRPDPELARKLLYSKEYHKAKERIMYPLEQFFKAVDERTADEVRRHQEREETLVFLLIGTTSLAALLAIVSIILMADSPRKI